MSLSKKPPGGEYIDFKKSCATFSSTLRNFQDDYQFGKGNGGNPPAPGDNQSQGQPEEDKDLEESIQEEIEQSHTKHEQQQKHQKRPPLMP